MRPSQPRGSIRDTPELARSYANVSHWQHERGLLLLDVAAAAPRDTVVDLGCGTGELTMELVQRIGPDGKVLGVDPDAARLDYARASANETVSNLAFKNATAESLTMIADGSVDLVYSNYVLQWVLGKHEMLLEVERVLRPGGRFVTEFLGKPIELFLDLIRLMPDSDAILTENTFLEETEWRSLIDRRKLGIERFEWPVFSLEYESLPALFEWLEATSHNAFRTACLTPEKRLELEAEFPGNISLECPALRMVLSRTR